VLVGWKKVTCAHRWFLAKREKGRKHVLESWHAFTVHAAKARSFHLGRVQGFLRKCLRAWRCRSAECAVLRDAHEAMRRSRWSSALLHAWHGAAEAFRAARRCAIRSVLRTWCALSSAGRRERWVRVEVFKQSHVEKLAWTALCAWSFLPRTRGPFSGANYSKMRISLDDHVTPPLKIHSSKVALGSNARNCKENLNLPPDTQTSVKFKQKLMPQEAHSELDKAIQEAESLLRAEMHPQGDRQGNPQEMPPQQQSSSQDIWECFLSGLEGCDTPGEVSNPQPKLIQAGCAPEKLTKGDQRNKMLTVANGKENQLTNDCYKDGIAVRPSLLSEVRSARGYASIHSNSLASRTSSRLWI